MAVPYNAIYKRRGLLMIPPCLFILFVFYRETESAALVWPAGLALFCAGVGIRIWAQMHLHYRLRERKILTTTGPYVFVRNPIYIGNTLMLLGVTVLSELLWFLPVMLLWCTVVYHFVVRREETHLADKYGEPYREFMRSVPRWVPRLGGGETSVYGVSRFAARSILVELPCFLLILPFVVKEVWSTL